MGVEFVTGDVAGYLFFPESGVRLGFDVLGATTVAVPEQVKKLPHEFFNFNEFENEWNADISGAFASSEQFVRIF